MEIKIQNLHNQAVDAALDHNWQKAIELVPEKKVIYQAEIDRLNK